MKRKLVLMLVACVMLCAVALDTVCAQPVTGGRGNAGRGGTRGGATRGGMGRGGGFGFQAAPPGPPAPVPPEVAIPRPTEQEIAKMNEELQKFINSYTGTDKEVLKKYASLITVDVPRDNPCIRPTTPRGGQHDSFVETANNGDFDIMFLGDSITYLWTVGEGDMSGYLGGLKYFNQYFGDMKVANFGIAGDTTQAAPRSAPGAGAGDADRRVLGHFTAYDRQADR